MAQLEIPLPELALAKLVGSEPPAGPRERVARVDTAAELAKSPFRGALFEGSIAAEVAKLQVNRGGRRELYYFRDQQGLGVDFVIPGRSGALALVECKAGMSVTPAMAAPLARLAQAAKKRRRVPARIRAFLVHEASRSELRSRAVLPGVEAVPWADLLRSL